MLVIFIFILLRSRSLLALTHDSGVGFGTCQRLLVQLSEPRPSDTLPSHPSLRTAADAPSPSSPFTAPNGVTLLLACRNAIKAHRARVELQHLLDDLAALPDDSPPLMGVPPPSSAKMREGGGVDEDADPALVAQEEEASVRRRRTKRAGLKEPEVEVERQIETEGEREREREQGDEQEQLLKRSGSSGREDAAKRAAYRRRFCKGTRIEFVPLDLGSMASALECAKEVRER